MKGVFLNKMDFIENPEMTFIPVSIKDLRSHTREVIEKSITTGKEIYVMKREKPIIKLVPFTPSLPSK